MDIDQARAAYQKLSPRTSSREEVFPHQADIEQYKILPPDQQRLYVAIMERFLIEGEPWERNTAAQFLEMVPISDESLRGFVDAYIDQKRDDRDPLATFLGTRGYRIQPDQLSRLRDVFRRDPSSHMHIAQVLIENSPTGPDWDLMISVARTTSDVRAVELAFNAAFMVSRVKDFYGALKGRSEDVLREYAARRRPAEAAEFLSAVGLVP